MRPDRKPSVSYNTGLMAEDMAARGWMNTDLARMAKVADMTVYRWFSGLCRTARTAQKLAHALGHPVERYLIRKPKQKSARVA